METPSRHPLLFHLQTVSRLKSNRVENGIRFQQKRFLTINMSIILIGRVFSNISMQFSIVNESHFNLYVAFVRCLQNLC